MVAAPAMPFKQKNYSFAKLGDGTGVSLIGYWWQNRHNLSKCICLCSLYRNHTNSWEAKLDDDVYNYIEILLPEESPVESINRACDNPTQKLALQSSQEIDRLILERWNGLREIMLDDCIDPSQEKSILMFGEMLLNSCGDANDN